VENRADGQWVIAAQGQPGFVMYGPYMPLRPGRYRCTLRLDFDPAHAADEGTPIAFCDAVGGPDATTLARTDVVAGQREVTLSFTVEALLFGGQFRCVSLGPAGFAVKRQVMLDEHPLDMETVPA